MGGTPDMLFVIDTNHEQIAIKEAQRLGIPVIGVVDSNCDPDGIDYPVPGNDDAMRAIQLYCDLIAKAALDGIQIEMSRHDKDAGASAETPAEPALKAVPQEGTKKEPKKEPKGESKQDRAQKADDPKKAAPKEAAAKEESAKKVESPKESDEDKTEDAKSKSSAGDSEKIKASA